MVTALTMTVLVTGLLLFCNGSQVTGGSGTGVGNAVVSGKVIYGDSTPVAGATVRVRPASYVQDTLQSAVASVKGKVFDCSTDSMGVFRIESLDKGTFSIEVVDIDDSDGTLIKFDYRDTGRVVLEPRVVKPLTKISGSIVLAGLPQNAWVQMYGIECLGKTDAQGRFEITDLPLGDCEEGECEYKLRITTVKNKQPTVFDYEMEVEWKLGGVVVEIELEDD